jgi:MYXO-CTERM domain-containing protein
MRLSLILAVTTVCWLFTPAARADNICGESVPSNRISDGIPAYAQCDATNASAIYSNNGVDTAVASGGTGWVRTQMSGGYQCTELAHRYLYFRWNVKSVPNGNAGVWCDGTLPAGLVKSSTPMHGDLIVFAPGSCGADTTTGHVAVVDVVNSNSTVTFVEQNRPSRRSCAINTAACFLHATANDGSDGGVPDGAVTDATPAAIPDARPPRDLASDRDRPDTALAGAGGTSATGGTTGAGGRSDNETSSTHTGGAGRAGGSVASAGGGQAGSEASTSPAAGGTGTVSTGTASQTGGKSPQQIAHDKASTGCACTLVSADNGGAWPALLLGLLLLWRGSRRRLR